MFVLLIDNDGDYGPPDVHGPFETLEEAQGYAERYRGAQGLPREATPDNNDAWTDAGWYFGIFEPRIETFADFDPNAPSADLMGAIEAGEDA